MFLYLGLFCRVFSVLQIYFDGVADRRCVTVACNPMSVENQMEDIRYFLSWRYCRYYLASFRSTACALKWMEFSVFVIILFLVVQFPLPNQHNMLLDKEYIEN